MNIVPISNPTPMFASIDTTGKQGFAFSELLPGLLQGPLPLPLPPGGGGPFPFPWYRNVDICFCVFDYTTKIRINIG